MTLDRTTARIYPLNSLGMLGKIVKEFRNIAKDYSWHITEELSNPKEVIKYFDKKNPDFYFTVTYEIVDHITSYGTDHSYRLFVSLFPSNESVHRHGKFEPNESEIENVFKSWISLIISYNTAVNNIDTEDEIQMNYEKEFISEIKMVDKDSDTASFDDEKQKMIYHFLSYVEMAIDTIQEPTEIITNLKNDIAEFKEEIPSITKKQVIEKGSKLYGVFKKLGPAIRDVIIKKSIEFAGKKIANGSALQMIEKFQDFVLPK